MSAPSTDSTPDSPGRLPGVPLRRSLDSPALVFVGSLAMFQVDGDRQRLDQSERGDAALDRGMQALLQITGIEAVRSGVDRHPPALRLDS